MVRTVALYKLHCCKNYKLQTILVTKVFCNMNRRGLKSAAIHATVATTTAATKIKHDREIEREREGEKPMVMQVLEGKKERERDVEI